MRLGLVFKWCLDIVGRFTNINGFVLIILAYTVSWCSLFVMFFIWAYFKSLVWDILCICIYWFDQVAWLFIL